MFEFEYYIINSRSQEGYTSLIAAAEKGYTSCVRLLLDFGAIKNAMNHVRMHMIYIQKNCR